MKPPTRTLLAALLALVGAGCGDDPVTPGVRADASPDTTVADVAPSPDAPVAMDAPAPDAPVATDAPAPDAPADRAMMAMVGPYPAGPYGRNEGQTLANLAWEGYTNLDGAGLSTERPFAPTSMQAVRETGRAYALVHVSEFF